MNKQLRPTIRFVYSTTTKGRRTTIAYTYDDSAKCIRAAAAQCSTKDRFVKRIGRHIATNRLRSGGVAIPYQAMGYEIGYGNIARYLSSVAADL